MDRHLYIDPFTGTAGDMLLAALLDLGADPGAVEGALEGVRFPGVERLRIEAVPVEQCGLRGLGVRVLAEPEPTAGGQPLAVLRDAIAGSRAPDAVRGRALAALETVARAEAAVHGVPPEAVHFHELGGVDTVADLLGVCAAVADLGVTAVTCGALPLGRGAVRCAHGRIPNPPPATLRILEGVPVHGVDLALETVTPTGAALVRTLADGFGPAPAGVLGPVGTGFGTSRIEGRPNCTRVWWVEPPASARETVWQVEATLDDLPGELLATLVPACLEAGAVDAWLAPVLGKKGRPAHVVTALCPAGAAGPVEDALFRHSSTLGVRRTRWERTVLKRTWQEVATPWGPVRVKVGSRGGRCVNRAPEFEDCAALAREAGVPVKDVYEAALAAALTGAD